MPLAALLFSLAIDPLLRLFTLLIVKNKSGRVLAGADDLSACLGSPKSLKSMFRVVQLFSRVSGLTLSPRKCVIVLNSIRASPHNVAVIRDWLRTHIPAWAEFAISDSAKYMGCQMGPMAFCWQWDMPIRKFKARVESIAASGESAALSARQYSIKAVPILTYCTFPSFLFPLPNSPKLRLRPLIVSCTLQRMPRVFFRHCSHQHRTWSRPPLFSPDSQV